MNNIWQDLPRPFFALAPMEDVTDHVFRRVINKAAPPDLYFSEFTNATGWVHAGDRATGGRLIQHADEHYPIIAQIWGTIPEDIEKLARHCKKLGFKGIDINMGCPVKHAVKGGGGSAMIKTPELAGEIIAAAKKSGLPVSVKTRLGYSNIEEWKEWLGFLLQQDIAALTVHLRTRKEMSKAPAHWEIMPEIKKLRDDIAPHTLLIGNGDVEDRASAVARVQESDIDGVMIGRGVFSNVFAFEHEPHEHTKEELMEVLKYHLKLFETTHCHPEFISGSQEFKGQIPKQVQDDIYTRPFETMKRFFKVYVRDFDGAHELRNKLMQSSTIEEVQRILAKQ